jgi:hypothetical protein
MLKRLNSVLCCCAFALAALISMPVQAQSSSSSEGASQASHESTTNTTTASKNMSGTNNQSHNRMQVSKKAVKALRLTDQARQAIIAKDQAQAQADVNQALTLANQVEQKIPNNSKDNTHVVPIYAELEQTSFLAPSLAAKNASHENAKPGNSQNQQSASTGNSGQQNTQKQMASNALPQSDQPASNGPEVVKSVEGGFSYIGLDMDAMREHLQAAQQALKNNNPGNADLELARAQAAIVTGSIESNMPLVRARENLSLAQDNLRSGNYAKAKVELNAAAKALNGYSKDAQASHAKDAKNLGAQITSAANSAPSNHASVEKNVDTWWNQLADWTNQS